MATKKKGISRITLLIVLPIVLLFIILDIKNPSFLEVIELKALDYRFRIRGRHEPGQEVAIVIIDEQSIQEIGRWPWSRDRMAKLTDLLAEGGAKVIGFDILFSEPEQSGSLNANTDQVFSQSIKKAGRVILPIAFHVPASFEKEAPPTKKKEKGGIEASSYLLVKNVGESALFRPVEATDLLPPLDQFVRASNSLGHVYALPDRDGVLRWEFLSLKYGDEFYPAFSIQVVREYLGLKMEHLRLIWGESVEIGEIKVPTDEWGRLLINFNGPARSFPYYRAADLLLGKIEPSAFSGKIVLVGTTIIGIHDQWMTPFPVLMPGVEKHAHVIENILRQNFLYRTEGMKMMDTAFILLFGIILFLALPKLRALGGAIMALILLVGYMVFLQIVFNKAGLWIHFLYPSATILSTYTSITLLRFMTEERRGREIRRIFSSYVTPKIMEMLVADPEKARLGGQRKEVTVLFSDIRGFTSFSERHQPEQVVATLNEYLKAMTEVVFRWDGTLDKFVGDAMMMFWGAPMDQPNHAELAVRCALHMRRQLERLQEKWHEEGKAVLDAGIGINTGEVLVGNMGVEGKKMDYTVIGDHVNLAARVEGLTREHNAPILITEYTYQQIRHLVEVQIVRAGQARLGHIQLQELPSVPVKGKTQFVTLYAVTGLPPGTDPSS